MKVGNLLLMLMLLACLTGNATQAKNLVIYFAKDKDAISATEQQKLSVLQNADYVIIKGYADIDGDEQHNLALSKRRAEAVKAYVAKIDTGIKTEMNYYGYQHPINGSANEQEKSQNRRVEISYISNPLMRLAQAPEQY